MSIINRIEISNFRSIAKKAITFDYNFLQIVGLNGVGKTSILEAIYFMVTTKSFREQDISKLIKIGEPYAKVSGIINGHNYEVVLSSKGKSLSKDDIIQKKSSDYLGFAHAVAFSHSDVEIIDGYPINRRNFLDLELSLLDREYLADLSKYKMVLKQRNDLLKQGTQVHSAILDILSLELFNLVTVIVNKRTDFLDKLNKIIASSKDTFLKKKLELHYKLSNPLEKVENILLTNQLGDVLNKITSVGPHRDDIIINLEDEPLSSYGSSGYKYLSIIAIKMAIIDYHKELGNTDIIVLIDDILSNIDEENQVKLFSLIKDNQIITANVQEIKCDYDYKLLNI